MDPVIGELQSFVDGYFHARPEIRVLEAGCGSSSYLALRPGTQLVGIDISEKQLARNDLLSEKILGDIQTHEFPSKSFDMIVCWDVLEHLPNPERAVQRFLRAVKDDGIMVLAMPNALSLKGQITKWSPHWFHVWVYRTIFGRKQAGTEDHGPFKTYMRLTIAPQRLREFARQQGFSELFFRAYEANTQKTVRARFGVVDNRWKLLRFLTRVATIGRVDPTNSDYILVLGRTPSTPSRVSDSAARSTA